MTILQLAQDIETERENNKRLKEAMLTRMDSLTALTDALRSNAAAVAEQLEKLCDALNRSKTATMQELADRDEALANIIGEL